MVTLTPGRSARTARARRRAAVRAVLTAAATVALLGACTDDADTSDATVTSSTVTAPAPTAAPPGVPVPVVLGGDGVGVAGFGDDPDAVLGAVAPSLGTGTDTGWGPAGPCPGTEARQVVFDRFILVFADAAPGGANEGIRQFIGWRLDAVLPETGAPLPSTDTGITLGSTVADLRAAYGDGDVTVTEDAQGRALFAVTSAGLRGLLTAPDGQVFTMEAGDACTGAA